MGGGEEVFGIAGGEDAEFWQSGGDDEAADIATAAHEVVEAAFFAGISGEGEADASLGIGIDEESIPAAPCEGVAEVDADGGFTDSSFLACGSEDDHVGG